MKKKTFSSILAVLLMTALFFSCAVAPPITNGDGAGDTEPTGPDQIIITLVVPAEYEAELGASTHINLLIYGQDSTLSKMVNRVDGKITINESDYSTRRRSDTKLEVKFWVDTTWQVHFTNITKPIVDTTRGGTKYVTLTLDKRVAK